MLNNTVISVGIIFWKLCRSIPTKGIDGCRHFQSRRIHFQIVECAPNTGQALSGPWKFKVATRGRQNHRQFLRKNLWKKHCKLRHEIRKRENSLRRFASRTQDSWKRSLTWSTHGTTSANTYKSSLTNTSWINQMPRVFVCSNWVECHLISISRLRFELCNSYKKETV